MFNIEPIAFNILKNVSIYTTTHLSSDETDYFILSINKPDRTYTGLLCSISIEDQNVIKQHEHVFTERKDCVKNCILQGSIQKNPILMTYKDSDIISELQKKITAKKPCYEISFNDESFSLWTVSNDFNRIELKKALLSTGGMYIADGHHRWAAINEGFDNDSNGSKKILCYLVPASKLSTYAYHRILKGKIPLSIVFQVLKDKFDVVKCQSCIKPVANNQFGMFLKGDWYKISAKFNEFENNFSTEILNNEIIEKLASYNPSIDIHYFCDTCSMQEFEKNILATSHSIGFTTMSISTENLMNTADNLKILPPKSTWIEPKLPEGLFNYYF